MMRTRKKLIVRLKFSLFLFLDKESKYLSYGRQKVHHKYASSYDSINFIETHEELNKTSIVFCLMHCVFSTTSTNTTALRFDTQIVKFFPKFLHPSVVRSDVQRSLTQIIDFLLNLIQLGTICLVILVL